MASGKRYFWLKMPEDFFSNLKIKKLRKVAGGDTFTIIYLKMQLLSLRKGGNLIYEGVEDSLADELALMLDEDIENVKMTLAFMGANGLITISDEDKNTYQLPETMAAIGEESASAERVRRHRERKRAESLPEPDKALHCNAPVTPETLPVTENVTEPLLRNVEIEKELEIEKEKKKRKKKASSSSSQSQKDSEAREVIKAYTDNLNLQETLEQFLEMRKEIKKPMTGNAVKRLTTKLDGLATTDNEKIAILEESIINGWQSVWPLKNQPAQPKKAVPDCLNWGKEGNL